jgi:acyl-coenzyme A synthetase/AMP-(fatty) acid ligase
MPKTSSGKMQRYKLMQRYLNGDFDGKILQPDKQDYL